MYVRVSGHNSLKARLSSDSPSFLSFLTCSVTLTIACSQSVSETVYVTE